MLDDHGTSTSQGAQAYSQEVLAHGCAGMSTVIVVAGYGCASAPRSFAMMVVCSEVTRALSVFAYLIVLVATASAQYLRGTTARVGRLQHIHTLPQSHCMCHIIVS